MYLKDQICCPNLGEILLFVFLGLRYLAHNDYFQFHPFAHVLHHFILLYSWIIFHWVDAPLSPSTSAHTCMGVRPSTGTWETSQWEHPQKEGSLSHSYPLLISSHLGWCLESTAPIYAGLLSVLLVYMAVWVHVCNSHGQSSWVILHCVAFFDPFIC